VSPGVLGCGGSKVAEPFEPFSEKGGTQLIGKLVGKLVETEMVQPTPQLEMEAPRHLRLCESPAVAELEAGREPGPVPEPSVALHVAPPPLTFEALFSQHARFVAQVALRVIGRDDEVDDVVQEVFLCALRDLGKLQNPAAVRGWLKTITVRKAYRLLRRRRLRAWFGLDDRATVGALACRGPSLEELPAPGCSPEERALLLRVYRLLDQLPAAERLAWTLRYLDGEQVESVATLCGCSLATAKRRISAAHSFVERMLKDA
jgi:RNA polymerase sigma-70 factor (ECF subfamily)